MVETNRLTVPAAEEILGKAYKCLDDGFVRLVDYMGGDDAVVQAARVSYGAGTKKAQEDSSLIKYLLRNEHTSPFEMCEIKLHVRVPMDTWRQWIRHRTANVNEYSTRYSIAIDSAQKTSPSSWRKQSSDNKQGSSGFFSVEEGEQFSREETELHESLRKIYGGRIDAGMAREQARKDLPLSTYTEAYWKNDLRNIFHFLKLRMDPHAQYEIRVYANAIAEIVRKVAPIAYHAFEDYVLNSVSVSGSELKILKSLVDPEKLKNELQTIDNLVKSGKAPYILHGMTFGKTELKGLRDTLEKKLIDDA